MQNAEKNDEEKITQGKGTTEAQISSPCREIGKEGREVCSEGDKQVILMHIAFLHQTRSEPDVVTILPTASSIAAFSFLRFYPFFVLAYLRFEFQSLAKICVAIIGAQ